MNLKNGQITLFIIVGLFLLGIFMLLFSTIASLSEEALEQQRERTVSAVLDAALIQRYTSVCVDDALEKGLRLIGLQGGMLFEGQPGGVITPASISFSESDVSFGIVPRVLEPPELYPCSEQFAASPPAFCRYPNIQSQSPIIFGQRQLPLLESPASGGILSVQRQLERYIAAYVQECVDVATLQREEGFQAYSIEEGLPEVEVTFRNTAVVARVDYPLFVSIGGEEPVTQFAHFETRLPVRFRHIYDAVSEIIRKDTSDIIYNLRTDALQELSFLPVFPYPLGFRYVELGPDDIFIIEDPFSKVRDQNYIFQTARKNRPPALDYIHLYESLHDAYDYLLLEGETVNFEAHAEDPDEDTVHYEWSSRWSGNVDSGTESSFSKLISVAGYYNVTMNATDGDLGDWQEVRILADRKLESQFAIDNGYVDVPNDFISIEDPFFLDASATNTTLDPYAAYTLTWNVLTTPPQAVQQFCSIFPGYGRCDAGIYDTSAITINSVRDANSESIPLGTQDIALDTVLQYNGFGQSDTTTQRVEVVECLPHRNPGTAPYPYNEEEASSLYPNNPEPEPFQANHACCTGDFTIAGPDTVCYTSEQCGHPAQTLLYRRNRFCSGDRGNTCEGDWSDSWDNLDVCGSNGKNECFGVADAPEGGCQGFTPFTTRPYASGAKLWCNGPTGCEKLGCGKRLFIFEVGGIDADGNGLNSPDDYCGCTEEDVANQRECIKDEGVTDAEKKGVCTEIAIVGTNYCG